MRQNWNELEDSYPDTFMSRVGNINENLQGYITSSTEDVDSLRYEQLSFTFEQIQNNLDGEKFSLWPLVKCFFI